MLSISHVVAHHIFSKVGFNKFLVCVPIESATRLIYLFSMINDPRLKYILRQHFLHCLIKLREVVGVVLLESAFGVGDARFHFLFILIDSMFEELMSLVRCKCILMQ